MSAAAWPQIAERGSLWGLRVTKFVYRLCGQQLAALLVAGIALYFFVTDRRGRDASRTYLRRLYEHPEGARALAHSPTILDSYRHYLQFGLAALDRLRFSLGDKAGIDLVVHGEDALARLVERGEGGVLVGAHLGSFDALRALAARAGVVVNIVMSTRHAARIASVLTGVDDARVRVFDIDFAGPQAVFELRASVARGEFVALLADRVMPGVHARPVRARFLGTVAPFPRGPFMLAATLQCPMILLIGIRRSRCLYEIHVEPLGAVEDSSRAGRQAWIAATVAEYASRLERHCLDAPLQWFNFYDFWDERKTGRRVAA